MRVYIASSWRNPFLDELCAALTDAGIAFYDFRAQPGAFSWSKVLKNPARLVKYEVIAALRLQSAREQFDIDLAALRACDVMLLVLPSGRSAHLEAGYFAGIGKPVFTLFAANDGIDLMHLLLGDASTRCTSVLDAVNALRHHRDARGAFA